jgi:hypothetical protein
MSTKPTGTTIARRRAKTPALDGRVTIENVNVPGYTKRVDATKYKALRRALLKVLPSRALGMTQAEMFAAVVDHLPPDLFPGGEKVGWWAKTVQLDLEAKGMIHREVDAKPLRWHRGK